MRSIQCMKNLLTCCMGSWSSNLAIDYIWYIYNAIIIFIIINSSSARHRSGPCWCLCPPRSMPVNYPSSPCPVTTPSLLCSLLITAVGEHCVKQDDSHTKSHDLLLQLGEIPIWLHLELDLLGGVADFVFNRSNFWVWVVRRQKQQGLSVRTSYMVMAMPLTLISSQT